MTNFIMNLFVKNLSLYNTKSHQQLQVAYKVPLAEKSVAHCRTDRFKNSYFPSTLSDWQKSDETIIKSKSISIFKSRVLSFIRPLESNVYHIFDPIGLKFLTRLRVGFTHLNEHKFRHNLQDCMNRLGSCSLEIEDKLHYLLHCHHFSQ